MPDLDPAALQADPSAMAAQLMADLGRTHPSLAMLAQVMLARSGANARPEAAPDRDGEIVAIEARLAETEAELEATRRDARRVLDAHRASSERLSQLAAALGACGLCWGDDPGCPSCRGRGRPGMVRPDTDLRARLFGVPRRRPVADEPASHS